MKAFFLLLLLCWSAQAEIGKTNITLKWDYPLSEMTTSIEFRVWHQTNSLIAFSTNTWSVVTNVSGLTNTIGLGIQPGVHFYLLTARFTQGLTNETTGEVVYLESDPSNSVLVHVPRRGTNLTVRP